MAARELADRLDGYAAQDDIELSFGGRLRFTHPEFVENRAAGEKAQPADPIIHEPDSPTEYITVHYQNGNYEWFEFNFRVRDGVAYLGSKMKLSNPHNGRGWIPPEVEDTIQAHHPELEVSDREPPWWE